MIVVASAPGRILHTITKCTNAFPVVLSCNVIRDLFTKLMDRFFSIASPALYSKVPRWRRFWVFPVRDNNCIFYCTIPIQILNPSNYQARFVSQCEVRARIFHPIHDFRSRLRGELKVIRKIQIVVRSELVGGDG